MEPSAAVAINYEENCRLIGLYGIYLLDSSDGKNLYCTAINREREFFSNQERVGLAVLGTLEKIKTDMVSERPVWFFHKFGATYPYVGETCPYSWLAFRTIQFLNYVDNKSNNKNLGPTLEVQTRDSLERCAKSVQDAFMRVDFGLSQDPLLRSALNSYVREQVFPMARRDNNPEGKLATAQKIITCVEAALSQRFVPGRNFEGRVELQ